MSDCKPISSDVDALIEEMNALVVMEQDAADNAQNYMLPTWEDSYISLSEFCEEVHSRLDEYCSLSDSLKILEIINRYAKLDVKFFRELEGRYGKTSTRLKEFRFFEYSTVEHQRQDIWKLKEASPDAFVAVLRVASEVYRDLIPHPANSWSCFMRQVCGKNKMERFVVYAAFLSSPFRGSGPLWRWMPLYTSSGV